MWHGLADQADMKRAWRNQQARVGLSPSWSKVQGPAGAVIMPIRRAGWSWPAWDTFCTKQAFVISMREQCTMDVIEMLARDIKAALWEGWTSDQKYEQLHPAPFIDPTREELKARGRRTHARNAARKCVIAGGWTRAALHEIGKVDSDGCQACHQARGTPHHRYYCCPALRDQRNRAPVEWQHVAEGRPDALLRTRGLARHPEADWSFEGNSEESYYQS